jgi:SM-20-related protein
MDRFGSVIEALVDRGVAVCRDFLPAGSVALLADEARALYAGGSFRQAAVGRETRRSLASEIRGDQVRWLDEAAATTPQACFWEAFGGLKTELNTALYLGLAEFEGHYAAFPPGAHYRKHLDRFADSDARVISAVLYLNPRWRPEFGGALRLYAGNGYEDVFPVAGTLVVFRSDSVFHEVLPARRLRFSLTGWFRRRGASVLETLADPGAGRDAA